MLHIIVEESWECPNQKRINNMLMYEYLHHHHPTRVSASQVEQLSALHHKLLNCYKNTREDHT